MKDLIRLATTIGVAALLAGCDGSGPTIGAPQTPASGQVTKRSARLVPSVSRVAPATYSGDILYAAGAGRVYLFTYPAGKRIRTLRQDAGYICSDQSGDVFMPYFGKIFEYAHGATKPVAILSDDYSAGACSVDPKTGNLAVTNFPTESGSGNIAIYAGAEGSPTYLTDPDVNSPQFCGYDNSGNLFFDGWSSSYEFRLAELPEGSTRFVGITLNKSMRVAGPIQWDGTYITLQAALDHSIYRIQVAGSSGTIVGTTKLGGWNPSGTTSSWIQGDSFVAPTEKRGKQIGIWQYPEGGKPAERIPANMRRYGVHSVTISI